MTDKEKTKAALLSPSRGTLFSEMLTYWCCVISVDGGQPRCIEGNKGRLSISKYDSIEAFERRYRYSSIEGHWVSYHDSSESNAERFEQLFIEEKSALGDKRDAILNILLCG
jgi:hypothetical protein